MNVAAFVIALIAGLAELLLTWNLAFIMFSLPSYAPLVGLLILLGGIMSIVGGCLALAQKRAGAVILRFCAGWYIIDCLIMFFGPSLIDNEALRFLVSLEANNGGVISLVFAVLFSVAAFCASAGAEEAEKKAQSALQTSYSAASTQNSPAPQKPKTFEPVLGVETNALITRGKIFLEENDFEQADRYFEQALNQSPENSWAYLGKLMTKLKVHNTDELAQVSKSLKDEKLFQRALKFANDEEKIQLEHCLEAQNNAQGAKKYEQALNMMKTINSSTRAQNILDLLASIAPYKDTETLMQEVSQKKQDIEIIERKYAEAWTAKREVERLNLPDIEEINRIAEMFEALGDYKDCKSLAEEVRRSGIERIEEAKRKRRIRKWLMIVALMAIIGAGAFYAYTKISAQKAEQARIEAEKNEEKSRIEALKLELQGQK